ncbi:MAG TPA: rhamnulokinase family protein [Candidatus Saccharimonadales bacterium]|jgi:rhamnulokinase|nr:rhamnulokinase family protein [Candidatus Saccharimonadales bacterium]
MEFAPNRKALVAIDLGAQSCRVSLLRWNQGHPAIEVVHRYRNAPLSVDGDLRWSLDAIFAGIMTGLNSCAVRAPEGIASVAIDGWAVDYVRLDSKGDPLALPFCYRDERTEKSEVAVHAIMPAAGLYALTGIQIMRLNTLYQLYADKLAGRDVHTPWINLPEFMAYRLCGKRASEYTNATHTGLVQLGTHSWCPEIFTTLGLDVESAPQIVAAGTILGPLTGDLASLPAFHDTRVILPACHDTASAVAAIPAVGDDWAFISSGTWSLVGTVLSAPCVTADACAQNFTNLGGVSGRICFLKNVNGLWLLRQCMDEWEQQGFNVSFEDIVSRCASLPAPPALINVDEPELMLPGDMLGKIGSQLARLGQPQFTLNHSNIPLIANTIFHSMARRYSEVLSAIGRITGRKLRRLFMVGGGSKNSLLNRLTAERSGLEIVLGSVESTTIGNFAVQMAALENPQASSGGVTAGSVAKWAEWLSAIPLVIANDRQTN